MENINIETVSEIINERFNSYICSSFPSKISKLNWFTGVVASGGHQEVVLHVSYPKPWGPIT